MPTEHELRLLFGRLGLQLDHLLLHAGVHHIQVPSGVLGEDVASVRDTDDAGHTCQSLLHHPRETLGEEVRHRWVLLEGGEVVVDVADVLALLTRPLDLVRTRVADERTNGQLGLGVKDRVVVAAAGAQQVEIDLVLMPQPRHPDEQLAGPYELRPHRLERGRDVRVELLDHGQRVGGASDRSADDE